MSKKDFNPKEETMIGKLPLHLWPSIATAYGCIGMLNGAAKYGRNNFRVAGGKATTYITATISHLYAWADGEECDPEDGVPNLAAALANIAILLEIRAADKLIDDRNIAGDYRTAIAHLREHVGRITELHKDKSPKHYTIQNIKDAE